MTEASNFPRGPSPLYQKKDEAPLTPQERASQKINSISNPILRQSLLNKFSQEWYQHDVKPVDIRPLLERFYAISSRQQPSKPTKGETQTKQESSVPVEVSKSDDEIVVVSVSYRQAPGETPEEEKQDASVTGESAVGTEGKKGDERASRTSEKPLGPALSKTDRELQTARQQSVRLSNGFDTESLLFVVRLAKFTQGSEELKNPSRAAPGKENSGSAAAGSKREFFLNVGDYISQLEQLRRDASSLKETLETLAKKMGRENSGSLAQIALLEHEIQEALRNALASPHDAQERVDASRSNQAEILKQRLDQIKTELQILLAKFGKTLTPEEKNALAASLLKEAGDIVRGEKKPPSTSTSPQTGAPFSEASKSIGKKDQTFQPVIGSEASSETATDLGTRSASLNAPPSSVSASTAGVTASMQSVTQMPISVRTVAELMKNVQDVQFNLQAKSIQIPVSFIVPYPIQARMENVGSREASKEKNVQDEEGELEGEGGGVEKQQVFAFIPPGIAIVGDHLNEGKEDELPLHSINLGAYLISATLITNLQVVRWLNKAVAQGKVIFTPKGEVKDTKGNLLLHTIQKDPLSLIQAQVQNGALRFSPVTGKENHPVVSITYLGAELFCKDNGFRLPSEAEWEKAAGMLPEEENRPLMKHRYGCGQDHIDLTLANYSEGFSAQRVRENFSSPVGFYNGSTVFIKKNKRLTTENGRSPYGCYDMSGNVREWVFNEEYQAKREKITKGGSYESPPFELRVAARYPLDMDVADPATGFRVVLDISF